MKRPLKAFAACLLLSGVWSLLCPAAIAQTVYEFPPNWNFQYTAGQSSIGTSPMTLSDEPNIFILVDDFEYLDSPYNHGWWELLPGSPIRYFVYMPNWRFETVFDSLLGSRVLNVYRPYPIYPSNYSLVNYPMSYSLFTPPSMDNIDALTYIDLSCHPIVSFDFRSRYDLNVALEIGIDVNQIFECAIRGKTVAGQDITVRILPDPEDQPPDQLCEGSQWSGIDAIRAYRSAVTDSSQGSFQVTVYVDIAMMDTHWHTIEVDVSGAVRNAVDNCEGIAEKDDWYMTKAQAFSLADGEFRIDHIGFVKKSPPETLSEGLSNPDLFELGPLYARIFEPHRYLFMADYEVPEGIIKITDLMFDPENFLLVQDPDNPNDPVVRYWTDLGADPNRFGKEPDPTISGIMGREFIVDLTLPIFTDPGLRLTNTGPGPSANAIIDSGKLYWNVRISSNTYEYESACTYDTMSFHNLPVYPYDGIPTYLPAHYDAVRLIKAHGKPFFTPDLVFRLEAALWNAGVTVWPNIVAMDWTPEYFFEDLTITMGVSDGAHWDTREFLISSVNYPMYNYPPVVQLPIKDQIFAIGRVNEYIVNFIDPDCFIFFSFPESEAHHVPGFPISSSYRTDMEKLTWGVTINGLPEYQYGPWIEQIVSPSTGLISWVSNFEGAYDTIFTCTDARSASGFGQLTIVCRQIPVVQISYIMAPYYYPLTTGYPFYPFSLPGLMTKNPSLPVPPIFGMYGLQGGYKPVTPPLSNRFDNSLVWPPMTRYPNLFLNTTFMNIPLGFSGGIDSYVVSDSILFGMVMPW